MNRSKLVEAIGIKGGDELKALTAGLKLHSKKVAKAVLIHNETYEEAGEPYDMSKHAVYELLKRIYKKKFGREYGSNQRREN